MSRVSRDGQAWWGHSSTGPRVLGQPVGFNVPSVARLRASAPRLSAAPNPLPASNAAGTPNPPPTSANAATCGRFRPVPPTASARRFVTSSAPASRVPSPCSSSATRRSRSTGGTRSRQSGIWRKVWRSSPRWTCRTRARESRSGLQRPAVYTPSQFYDNRQGKRNSDESVGGSKALSCNDARGESRTLTGLPPLDFEFPPPAGRQETLKHKTQQIQKIGGQGEVAWCLR